MTKFTREQTETCVQLHPTSPHGMPGWWAGGEPHVSDRRGIVCVSSAAEVFLSSVSSSHRSPEV